MICGRRYGRSRSKVEMLEKLNHSFDLIVYLIYWEILKNRFVVLSAEEGEMEFRQPSEIVSRMIVSGILAIKSAVAACPRYRGRATFIHPIRWSDPIWSLGWEFCALCRLMQIEDDGRIPTREFGWDKKKKVTWSMHDMTWHDSRLWHHGVTCERTFEIELDRTDSSSWL